MQKTILVTGGAGYIGSHTAVQALEAGYEVIILDSLINSSAVAIDRIEKLTGKRPTFVVGDIRNTAALDQLFSEYEIDSVIHFAGLKAVGESTNLPLSYYDVNVNGTIRLVEAMSKAGVKNIVFSSSATVYGEEASVPYVETQRRGTPSSPYGATKAMVEQILSDLCDSDPEWSVVLLRYFNPIGAHPSGQIGEDPKGIPNNLMPFVTQVAIGRREQLSIFGNDYPTTDGTCERDYLHVMDLADGHLSALNVLDKPGCQTFNLGTGSPISVLEMVTAFQKVTGVILNYQFDQRRSGDLAAFWADAKKAKDVLGWKAERTLEEMLVDSWKWQVTNPEGYA